MMNLANFLRTAVFLSINRSIGQVAPIAIFALLGHYNTHLLASFTVLSANMGIFFIVATAGVMILQTEFVKLRQEEVQKAQFFTSTLVLFLTVSCSLFLIIFFIDPHYLIQGNGTLFDDARHSLATLALCIPLNAINSVMINFIEANGHAKSVSKIQIGQTLSIVMLISIILMLDQPTLFKIVVVYVISGFATLTGLIFLIRSKHLLCLKNCRFSSIKQIITPFKISAPSTISQITVQYGAFILTATAASFGAKYSAVLSTILSLIALSQIMVVGISQQMAIEVAQMQNAQQPVGSLIKIVAMVLVLITIVFIVFLLLAPTILGQLITNDAVVLQIFTESISNIILFFLACVLLTFLMSLSRSLGDYLIPQITLTIATVGFITYVTLIHHIVSFAEIFHCYLIYFYCVTVVLVGRLLYLKHRKIFKLFT